MNKAQDTVSLKEVDILADKCDFSSTGKKLQTLDSSLISLYRYKNISDLLTENTTVFIKNYGPGSLSSTALRGGSAYHTALLWNGFNIQNPMLGQCDLSTLPVFLFDRASVEFGGSSSLWGSGAVAGSINLNNASPYNRGTSTQIHIGTNSFGAVNVMIGALYSKKNWILSTKLYGTSSKNTYRYKNDTGAVLTQNSAPYLFRGLLQEFRIKLGPKQSLSVNAWLNGNNRQIPPADQASASKTFQKDYSLRTSAAWNYEGRRLNSFLRTAAFAEQLDYTDSLIALYSKSRSTTLIAEQENFFQYHPGHRLHFGVNFTGSSAESDNYSATRYLNRLSFLAGQSSAFFKDRLLASLSLRAEYFSAGVLPITGNLALNYKPIRDLAFRVNTAKIYRQPTLNELYWQPGGNPSLKPEQGYSFEGGVDYRKQFQNSSLTIGLSAYTRQIQDWVLWVPGPSVYSSPVNIQSVWSRGTESDFKFKFTKGDFGWQAGLHTSYVLATVSSSGQENSATEGKQLIYTPRYMGILQASVWYESTSLSLFHQYTGYRFTTSDNSQWLDPYHLTSLKLNYSIEQKNWQLITFIACNNLFNTDYRVMAGRPMPLRNFEIGISLISHYKKASK